MSDEGNKNLDKSPETIEVQQEKTVESNAEDNSRTQEKTDHAKFPDTTDTEAVSKKGAKAKSSASDQPSIVMNAEFTSFLQLRGALEKYQRENSVQLIVKDSKLLKAESTRKIIPKVYHLVNQELMYHSITYTCKCHGELKQKPGTRMKNVGQKRLNCPMYLRFKLSPDLQKLVLFDLHENHNHGIDTTTFQMTPRQQVYQLSRMKRKNCEDREPEIGENDEPGLLIQFEVDTSISDSTSEPPQKALKTEPDEDTAETEPPSPLVSDGQTKSGTAATATERPTSKQINRAESPLDSDSSCSDSDEEEIRTNRSLLPFPIRLIGSAITSNPELIASTKELLDIQKSKLNLEKQKLVMETKLLELTNTKLELEVRQLEKTLQAEANQSKDTTIFLQAP